MYRRLATAAGGLLVLFHAWLLGSQLWDGQFFEPGLAFRWLVAGGLVAALIALRRQGGSLIWGRKAVSIWLLAAMLHGPAVADSHLYQVSPALPEAVTTLVQIATAAGLGLGLLLLASALRRRATPRVRPTTTRSDRRPGTTTIVRLVRLAPRPPPLRSTSALV